jgi:hypothetical protein
VKSAHRNGVLTDQNLPREALSHPPKLAGLFVWLDRAVTIQWFFLPEARRGLWRWNMGNRISKAIVAGVAALSLVASAVATAEPAAAQWSDNGHGFWQGGGIRGSQETRPSWGDDFSSDDSWGDSCWQVRPVYSITGAWLDNRRVNVC